ncbi:MAG: transketolase C-terminal domain-containing protein, partial [Fidelibacterota bacterium]
MDECVGHMTEKVIIPPPEEIKIYPRRFTDLSPEEYLPFKADGSMIPDIIEFGKGYKIHVTGLTHDERGYPVMSPEAQECLVRRIVDKIRLNADEIIHMEERDIDNADVIVVSYGITSRVTQPAIIRARREGIHVGHIKLVTIWPFPEKRIRELAEQVKAFVVPEINYGQIVLEVERAAAGKAKSYLVPHGGGWVHDPGDIYKVIMEAAS